MAIVEILIGGKGGRETVRIPAEEWGGMSPIAKVLAIHARLPEVTCGKPFTIECERLVND